MSPAGGNPYVTDLGRHRDAVLVREGSEKGGVRGRAEPVSDRELLQARISR